VSFGFEEAQKGFADIGTGGHEEILNCRSSRWPLAISR
jgi:hypothetical protein